MKKAFHSAVSALTAALIAFSSAAAASAAGDRVEYTRKDEISNGLTFTYESYKEPAGRGGRSYIYDYEPGGTTVPIVAYGSELYGKSDVNEVVNYCEKNGQTVMAAFNGDFFSMSSGIPTGIVIREGRLCSSDGAWNAVGFTEEGRTIIGAPKLDITFSVNGGQRYPIAGFNKVRDPSGIFLYSHDYGKTTRLSAEGMVVILEKTNPDEYMSVNNSISLRVREAGMSSGESKLDENTFVLTHQKAANVGIDLSQLKRGDLLTVYTGTRSQGWDEVYYACGAGDMMIENSALTQKAASGTAKGPRTMLGVKNDGSISILVCDGRSGGDADGMTLREAALELYERGCKNVVNLDGGGSSVSSARYPGMGSSGVVSQPSDGRPRKCANFIVFVNTGDPDSRERYASVYPKDPLVLAGGTVELEAYTYNKDYFPGEKHTEGFRIKEGGGSIEGSVFTAPAEGGKTTVGTSIRSLQSVDTEIISVDNPAVMAVVKKGSHSAISSLSLDPGETIDLDVYVTDGLRQIISKDEQFLFEVSGNIGTVEPDGKFTACDLQGVSGSIKVSFGEKSQTLNVSVGKAPEVINDFEKPLSYTFAAAETTKAKAFVNLTADYARYGMGSLALSFETQEEMPDTVIYRSSAPMAVSRGMKEITFMTKGSGQWTIDFDTGSGIVSENIVTDENGGWTLQTVRIPSGASAIAGFTASGTEGHIYIDRITGHYGEAQSDYQPPYIDMLSFEYNLILRITDDGKYPLDRTNISVRIDGSPFDGFTYDEISGIFEAAAPQDGKIHRITVEARDYFGNLSRCSVDTKGVTAGPFGDMAGHWAEPFVNYLCEKGIFSADTSFNPQGAATNEMVATIISRYMGIDTAKYADTVLPYADADKIHDWAMPHVKALYSLGIMQGGSDAEGKVWFYPVDSANRARVMTVLGRTISRGYKYDEAVYTDMNEAPQWSRDHISLLTHLGVVNGYGGENCVKAEAGITRAEIAAILYRLY